MDTNIAHKIARAFVHGLAFAKGMTTLAQDAKSDMEKGDRWITVGAEAGDDGKKHGGRHVLISGTGEVKKGLSKSAQGKPLGEAIKELKDKAESKKAENKKAESKKAESKPAQQRTESWREMAIRHKQEVAARANRSQEDIEAAHQLFLKFDRGAMRTMMEVSEVTFPAQQRMRDARSMDIPGANANAAMSIRDSLRQIQSNIGTFDKTMSKIQSRIAKAISDGKIGEGRVDAELRDYRRYYDTFADYIARANKQMNNLDHTVNDGHQEDREVLSKIAGLTSELAEDAARWNNKLENANTPETHTYSAKELDGMKQKQEGRAKAKKQNAELNRKLKEGEKAATEQANQVTNDDKKALKQIKDLVPKIGPVFHQAKSDLDFYSPSEKRGILKEVRFPDAKVTENIKYLNELEGYVKKEKEVRALAKDLDAAIKAGKLTPEDRNIYVRNLKYGFDELTKGIQRGAHAMYDYAERANRGGYVSTLDDQWIREAVRQARGGLSHITWTADKLKASQPSISSESDRVDALYAQKGGKPKNRIIN